MTESQHLLTILGEECSEVAQRVSKSLRFGLEEIQEGQVFTNAERIMCEFADLVASYELLLERGLLPQVDYQLVANKKNKVKHWLAYSESVGELDRSAPKEPSN